MTIDDGGGIERRVEEKDLAQVGKRVVRKGVVNLDRWAAGIAMAQSSAYIEHLKIAVKYADEMSKVVEGLAQAHWSGSDLGGEASINVSEAYMTRAYSSLSSAKSKQGHGVEVTSISGGVPTDKPIKEGHQHFLLKFPLKRPKTFIRASKRLGLDEPEFKDSWYVSIRQNTERRKQIKLELADDFEYALGQDEYDYLSHQKLFGELVYTFNVELFSTSPLSIFVANMMTRGNELHVIATNPHLIEAASKRKKLLFWWDKPPAGLGLPEGGAAFMTEYVHHPGNVEGANWFQQKLTNVTENFESNYQEDIESLMSSGQFVEAMGMKTMVPRTLKSGGALKYSRAENFAKNFPVSRRVILVDDN